ncbi:MAG: proliferating cell nuclear antigen (pcna) [Candidatus Diapherotrites archaeon]|uniref:DNA polymerase sliding clamp n=1 Tax=Candidatus Iainarchaeum sp. TaxID=3101447 RepID=A0A8T3YLH0_9ARCH|nr:proliferating cell nuclear antigen (pcna) [Candidatus Diapherotrites archaeon]
MEIVYEDASLFKKFVDGLSALVDEAEFIVDDKGLSLKATDPSQISLVDFSIPRKAFRKFDVKEPAKLGADLNYFTQIMGRAKSGDSLSLSVSGEGSKLNVVFSGAARRAFLIPLLDLSTAELPLPRIDFDAEVKVKADALQDSFKDANLISTHVVLSVENDSFVLKASSSKGNLENVYSNKDKSLVSLTAGAETRAMFPLDYLVSILKASSSDTEVTVKLKTNAPVEISYSVGEAKFVYFLAPRIESE